MKKLPAFAVVRVEGVCPAVPDDISVVLVTPDLAFAESEVERLSRLNDSKGCIYFWVPTRLKSP